jgi:methionyl-tRNA synthetase
MSKSLGNVLDPFKVIDVFGTDALRYYCLREVSFGQDGSVSTEGFEARYNTELANEYGNLASRTLAMITRYRDGVVPQVEKPSPELAGDLDGLARVVRDHFDRAQMTAALEAIWSRGVRRLNRYVEEQAPWTLAKEGSDERLDQVLHGLAEGIRVVSVLLHPYMPDTTTRLLDALGHDDLSLEHAAFGGAPGGAAVGKLPPLFPKIEPAEAA